MVLLLFCALTGIVRPAMATPQLNPGCPLNFFTNVASRLLSSQLNADLNHIRIYPTNQYTPAVHRLLQVTANVLDATTTNYYPSVFRPLFWKTNEQCNGIWQTNIYVVGYQYVQEPLSNGESQIIFSPPTDVSDARVPFGLSGITNNIYGVPWVIGVKKGLPNFNALELDNCFFIERELQFNRSSSAPAPQGEAFPFGRVYTTNQMYVIGISNAIGVDDWNSYASNYNSQVTIVMQDSLSLALTNDAGVSILNPFSTNISLTTNSWPGYSFVMPVGTNLCVAQNLSAPFDAIPSANSLYAYFDGSEFSSTNIGGVVYMAPCFIPTQNFPDVGTPPMPHFGLAVTNRLQAYIVDSNNCILDYVQLGGVSGILDINAAITDPGSTGLWSTNLYTGTMTPWGVVNQYNASSEGGAVPVQDQDGGFWNTAPVPGTGGNTSPAAQQAFFSAFFSSSDVAYYSAGSEYVTNTDLSILASFTPTRLVVQRIVCAANDPLVHYLTSDLNDIPDDTNVAVNQRSPSPILKFIGNISGRYMPWGTKGNLASEPLADKNPYNLAYKDPLVTDSDAWDFPTNQTLNASWLGQVHRGTPWQTIYLKSTNILDLPLAPPQSYSGIYTWAFWTGDANFADAASMAPVADWQVAALLASLFNTNSDAALFSANDPNPTDWENLLNGMTVLTNTLSDLLTAYEGPQFISVTISSASSQAAQIANGIESTRSSLLGQLFVTPGNIFAVPQLSDESPYLDFLDAYQVNFGFSDQAYEAIPDQLLPLLRVDSIGSMTTANGQAIIQFTGDDNHAYAVQVSPNLLNWTTISTNSPVNGIFTITNNVMASAQFYRTVLLY